MTGILTILALSHIISSEYQDLKLISQLNTFHNFDHNVLLLDASADPNRFINSKGNIPQSLYFFKSYDDNIIGLETFTEIKSKNTFMIVVVENGQFLSNLNFLYQFKKTQRLQINMKIGVFFSQFVSIDNLRKLFEWCKKHQIINIFATNYSQPEIVQGHCLKSETNIFSFRPFGAFDVMNVTGESLKNYFQKHNFNFQQHQLRLGEQFMFLFDEEIWLTVFQMMNATFVIVPSNTSEVTSLDGIDLIPRMNSPVKLKKNFVYPIRMGHQAFAAPEALPYSEFSTYLLTVTSDEFFGYSLITIAVVMILLIITRYIKEKKVLVLESVADVLNLLIHDNGCVTYQRLSRGEGFLIVPLTFVGFITVNGILSNLQSYLTRPINQPQIETMEDIFSSPFPIMIWTLSGADLPVELTNRSTYFRDKLVAVGSEEHNNNFLYFNTSNIYYSNEHYVKMAIIGQKRLGIRGYYFPQIRVQSYYGFYPVGETFLYFDRLNEIILLIRSAGLYDLWVRRYDAIYLEDLMKRNRERLKNYKEDDIDRFPIPMFIAYLWLASAVVFVFEIIWKNYELWLQGIWKKLKKIPSEPEAPTFI